MIQSVLQRKYSSTVVALTLLFTQASIEAATVILPRPVPLQAETITHLRQTHANEHNQWQLVVFGFTHCKDICPMSLANLAMLVKAAANEQIKLDGTFVTVDPDRDSEEILSGYTKSFGADIAYLRFEGEDLERFKATFGVETVFYTKNAGNQQNYQVDHSTSAFLIDPSGKIRVIFDALEDATRIAKMFRKKKELFKS
ncbi:SCO family protein [Nitrosomonas sp. Nm58]|uniref:SCO family protein n=1 Tax=Nitrosomonas sp. Nm58 TaxID=200126 RepID=UPI00089C9C85|nr:SCO family protein [Nitrosomonas sp. Nm58]SDZ01957.1 protein SCO1/2 [Nitrosomonas sp. Nm58]